MSKPLVAVDIDEVIFPMVKDLIEYVDRKHRVRISADEFIKYRLEDIWPGGPEEGEVIFRNYMKQSGVEVAPVIGAKEALEKLSERYELVVMTYRSIDVRQKTEDWLNHQFPDLFKNVHILGSSQEGFKYRPKGEVCKKLGVFCLIDDQPANVLSAYEEGIRSILFGDFPWNQANDLPAGIARANDWEEILEMLL